MAEARKVWKCSNCTNINPISFNECLDCSKPQGGQEAQCLVSNATPSLYRKESKRSLQKSLKNDEDTRHILLIGIPGSGKSSFGNSLLGEELFEADCLFGPVTREVVCGVAQRMGKEIVVFDTPGIEKGVETEVDYCEKTLHILSDCFWCLSPGFHVIALVIAIGRLSQDHITLLHDLQRVFDKECMKYVLVVFTRLDDAGKKPLEYLIQKGDKEIKEITRNGRYIGINNKAEEIVLEEQVRNFFDKVDKIHAENKSKCYTNDLFQESYEMLMRKAEECGISEAEARKNMSPTAEQKEKIKKWYHPCTIL